MAFRCAGRGAKQKPSEFVLLPETARFPSLPPLILAPFSREGRGDKIRSQLPYRKSSGICCTACSRTTNRRPFFFLLRIRSEVSTKEEKKEK